ncbi:hypothetical protein [uncultured Sphingomonas sp.]|uniref:hypothetical protein n=1 Tax=uncultured Sphingomonas sp. TaxID=158754 RepID=UPI0035CB12C1
MDLGTLSFLPGNRLEGRAQATALLAVAAARQAASPTAMMQARLPVPRVRTAASFAWPVADAIAGWRRRRGDWE